MGKVIIFRFNSNVEMAKDRFGALDFLGRFDDDIMDNEYFRPEWNAAENSNMNAILNLQEKYGCKIKIKYEGSYRYWNGGPANKLSWEDDGWDDDCEETEKEYKIPEEISKLRDKIEADFEEEVEKNIFNLYVAELDEWFFSNKEYDGEDLENNEEYENHISFGEGILSYFDYSEEIGRTKKFGAKYPKLNEKIEALRKAVG